MAFEPALHDDGSLQQLSHTLHPFTSDNIEFKM